MTEYHLDNSILKAVGDDPNGCTTEKVCRLLRNTAQELGTGFELLKSEDRILGFAGLWFTPTSFHSGSLRFMEALNQLHVDNPTQQSVLPEQVVKNAGLSWSGKPLDRILSSLAKEGRIESVPPGIRSLTIPLQLTTRQAALLQRVIEILETEPINTPTPHRIAQQLGLPWQAVEEILKLGVHAGAVLNLDESVYYSTSQVESLKEMIRDLSEGRPFSMTDLRDKLQTTRKYAMPLLDYLDSIGFTRGNANEREVVEVRA